MLDWALVIVSASGLSVLAQWRAYVSVPVSRFLFLVAAHDRYPQCKEPALTSGHQTWLHSNSEAVALGRYMFVSVQTSLRNMLRCTLKQLLYVSQYALVDELVDAACLHA